MSSLWHTLLANLAVVPLLVSIWISLDGRLGSVPPLVRGATGGAMFGLATIGVMAMPFEMGEGFYFDLRSALITLSGFAGGPLSCMVTGAAAAAYRVHVGGGGMTTGLITIANAVLVGIVAHGLDRRRAAGWTDMAHMALGAAAATVLAFVTLPAAVIGRAFDEVALPVSTLIFVATFAGGMMLVQDRRRREAITSNRLYRAIIEALPDCLNAKDLAGRFLAANPATVALLRADGVDELIGRTDYDFFPAEVADAFHADETRAIEKGEPCAYEQPMHHADGSTGWLSTLKAPLRDAEGRLIGLISHNRDISDQKRLEVEFRKNQTLLTAAMAHMADGVAMFDREARLIFCNQRYRNLFPRTADLRVPGAQLRSILQGAVERGEEAHPDPDGVEAWLDELDDSLGIRSDRRFQLADGRWIEARTRPTEDGCLVVYTDVTETERAAAALRTLNDHLKLLANTDALTGLVNRRGFDQALEAEFHQHARTGTQLALILVDIDRFKGFNDVYGHPAGDDCLRHVAVALRQSLRRPMDVAARYGGEELVAILPDTDLAGARHVAEAFRRRVRELGMPHLGSDKGIVTVSVGVASSRDAAGLHEMLRRADEALYLAKGAGRDQVRCWRRVTGQEAS